MRPLARSLVTTNSLVRSVQRQNVRHFQHTPQRLQERSEAAAHRDFWKSHGRAIFKSLTLAFFSYQVFYWLWITVETEQMRDQKGYEIRSLEGEVRLLEEGRKSHRPTERAQAVAGENHKLLEEPKGT